ncbi:MAG: carbon-nitrogen hydrolase family protein [Methanomassiliicoccaceae archaeon]|nr:carbon-nitrogen hydrolase family protein [Methanomassiliicoccaceae archaeon]
MGMRLALCQCQSAVGDVGANLNKIMATISQTRSDVYIFPELFLTGYGADYFALYEDVHFAIDKMKLWCMERDIAILVGAPSYFSTGVRNSLIFITPNDVARYDKLYPARFGASSEKEFTKGDRPMICTFRDMTFGLSICHDVFFPEIYRKYALSCADVNICAASSAVSSKPYFERILPARSLENLIYTVFVNSVGTAGDLRFYGSSKLIGPLGDTLADLGDDETAVCVYVDKDVVKNARKEKKHLEDRRIDIDWSPDIL